MKVFQLKKKRFITLVEMMIVMFLIAMITGVIAYNYTGSLDEGKAFKTKSGMDKIRTVLDLHLAANPDDIEHLDNWKSFIEQSNLVKNAKELTTDGWGGEYEVSLDGNNELDIKSEKYERYKNSKNKKGLFDK